MTWMTYVVSNVLLAAPIALIAWGTQRFGRQYAVARVLWVIVLLKLVTPPLVSIPLHEVPARQACREGTCGCPQHARIPPWNSLSIGLLAVWGLGAVATGWTAWRRWGHFERLLSHATRAPSEWQSAAEQISAELRIRRCPEVLAVPGQLPPMIVSGWRRLRLLVPLELVDRLGESQRSVLLLHELTHVRRGDHWMRLLELAVRVLYWWLPVVGFVSRQIRSCEEICCDAAVVSHRPQSRRDYACLLLDVIDFVTPPTLSIEQATGMNTVGDFELRLRAILHGTCSMQRRWPMGLAAALLAVGVIPWGIEYDWSRPPVSGATVQGAEEVAPEFIGNEACETPESRRVLELSTMCCPI